MLEATERQDTSIQFRTERLLLREMELGDQADHAAICSDPAVMKYMTGTPISYSKALEKLEYWIAQNNERPRKHYTMAITLPNDGQYLGRCALYKDRLEGVAFFGYHIARKYWGCGYITEAAKAMLKFGFTELGFHRIYAECHPDNIGSYRVMEKLGMQREGTLREQRLKNGIRCDSVVYAILDHEWGAQSPS